MKAPEQSLKLCRNSFLCNNEHILLSILWFYLCLELCASIRIGSTMNPNEAVKEVASSGDPEEPDSS